ncbi:MAG: hypothetical protein NVSMB31_17900 [Vulcanimicrobiaceae bacterium]
MGNNLSHVSLFGKAAFITVGIAICLLGLILDYPRSKKPGRSLPREWMLNVATDRRGNRRILLSGVGWLLIGIFG